MRLRPVVQVREMGFKSSTCGIPVATQLHRQMLRFDIWADPWTFASETKSVAVAVVVKVGRDIRE